MTGAAVANGDAPTRGGALPHAPNELVGREAEVTDVLALVGSRPLVTLTGTGGSGKTRLGLAVASAAARDAQRFPDGVWFADLVPVSDRAGVEQAVLSAFELSDAQGAGPESVLVQHLAEQRALLVLDNCDQVATWFHEHGT